MSGNDIKSKGKTQRRIKFSAISTVIAVFVTAIVILINIVFLAVTDRFGWVPDLTPGKMYKISDETVDYLGTLNDKIEIFVFLDEVYLTENKQFGNYLPQAAEILKQYDLRSSSVTLEYVDLLKDPSLKQMYSKLDLQEGQILFRNGDKTKVIDVFDLFNAENDQYGVNIVSSKAEQTITSAIMGITADKSIEVSILTGFDGMDMSALSGLFENNNYTVTEQNILTEDISKTADIALLGGIVRDLTKDEVKKLDEFLDNDGKLGKTLFYAASVSMEPTPNLDAFLKDWGIAVEKEIIYENDYNRIISSSSPFYFLGDAKQNIFTQSHDFTGKFFGFGNPRPVTPLFEKSGARSTTVLMSTTDSAKAIDSNSFDVEDTEDLVERDGPFDLMVMGEKIVDTNGETSASYVIVSGSEEAFDEKLLSGSTFGNAEYFVGMFNTIYDFEIGVVIAPKNFGETEIAMSFGAGLVWGLIFAILLPIVIVVTGIVIWYRRRRR